MVVADGLLVREKRDEMRCDEKELGMLVAGCGWGSGICEIGSRHAFNMLPRGGLDFPQSRLPQTPPPPVLPSWSAEICAIVGTWEGSTRLEALPSCRSRHLTRNLVESVAELLFGINDI